MYPQDDVGRKHTNATTGKNVNPENNMVDRFAFSSNRDLSFVDHRILSHVAVDRERDLPADFEPDEWTVICSRGLMSFHHGKSITLIR